MKFTLLASCSLLLALVACSTKESSNPGKTFSFDVSDTTKADDMTIAIERSFLDAYAQLDTSIQAAGQLMTTKILSYDSVSGQTKCIDGYTMQLNEYSKSGGEWVRNFNKAFFFPASGLHYQIWNTPVAAEGQSENRQANLGVSTEYLANEECMIMAVFDEASVADPSGGANESQWVTFYYWSEYEHRLKPVAKFNTGLQRAGEEKENVVGEIAFVKSGNKPYDIEYKVTGDSSYTEYYGWKSGRYVRNR